MECMQRRTTSEMMVGALCSIASVVMTVVISTAHQNQCMYSSTVLNIHHVDSLRVKQLFNVKHDLVGITSSSILLRGSFGINSALLNSELQFGYNREHLTNSFLVWSLSSVNESAVRGCLTEVV